MGEDDGLDSITEMQFLEDMGDVRFDCGVADVELFADFGVGVSPGDRSISQFSCLASSLRSTAEDLFGRACIAYLQSGVSCVTDGFSRYGLPGAAVRADSSGQALVGPSEAEDVVADVVTRVLERPGDLARLKDPRSYMVMRAASRRSLAASSCRARPL